MKATLKTPLTLFVAILLVFTHNLVLAKVYKCKGADGKIEYRQTACPVDAEQNKMDRLNYKAPQAAPGDNPIRKAQALDRSEKQSRQNSVSTTKEREKDKARCKSYKDRLARYKKDGIMGINLVTGEKKLMTGDGAKTAMQNAKDNVDIVCS